MYGGIEPPASNGTPFVPSYIQPRFNTILYLWLTSLH